LSWAVCHETCVLWKITDNVISHAILDTRAINIVKPKASSILFLKAQNVPKTSGKHKRVRDIHKNTFEALSAEYVVVGDENV
jgi:hypothetical protein